MNLDIKQLSHPDIRVYFESEDSFKKAWNESDNGNCMIQIARMVKIDKRILIRANALCMNAVCFLITDKRIKNAIDVALQYANGDIDIDELDKHKEHVLNAYNEAKIAYFGCDKDSHFILINEANYCLAEACLFACGFNFFTNAIKCIFNACKTYEEDRNILSAYYINNQLYKGKLMEMISEKIVNICREVLTDAVFEKVKQLNNN
jgi:hypothetical protein